MPLRKLVDFATAASMGAPTAAGMNAYHFGIGPGVRGIHVHASPAHVDTTGWTLRFWFRVEGGDWHADSADVQPWTVSGSGLPARREASTQILEFGPAGAVEGYVQLDDATGSTVAIDLAVIVEDY